MTILATLPEVWAFRSTSLSTYATLVRRVDGADAFPALRGSNVAIPSLPGRFWSAKVPDSRRVTLALWVTSMDADGADVPGATDAETARANLDALYRILALRTRGSLERVMPDGSTRTAVAEVVEVDGIEDRRAHQLIGLVVDFELADPYFYGAELVEANAIPASPTSFVVAHPGTVKTHRILLDFEGPISNPRVANLTRDPAGGHYVEVLVAVAAGEHLVVDCGAFTATNEGVEAIGSVRHSGAFAFLELDPGDNTLEVTATSPGGTLTITFDPPYI